MIEHEGDSFGDLVDLVSSDGSDYTEAPELSSTQKNIEEAVSFTIGASKSPRVIKIRSIMEITRRNNFQGLDYTGKSFLAGGPQRNLSFSDMAAAALGETPREPMKRIPSHQFGTHPSMVAANSQRFSARGARPSFCNLSPSPPSYKPDEEAEPCPICLDHPTDDMCATQCKHLFHSQCLLEFLRFQYVTFIIKIND